MKKISVAFGGLTLVSGLMASPSTLAFGSLAEFLDTAGNIIRTTSIFTTDIVAEPRWASGSTNVVIQLCTGGNAYSGAPIRYQSDRDAEILTDVQEAANTWNGVSGGITFGTAVANSGCGPSGAGNDSVGAPNGQNRVSFTNNLPAGVLALTHLHMTASGGVLTINEADIQFNTNFYTGMGVQEVWTTKDCHTQILASGGTPTGTCSPGDLRIGFRGVLVHELGHFIGLSHSLINDDYAADDEDNPSTIATMFPAISNLNQSVTIENLGNDDILSKRNLYNLTSSATTGTITGTVYSAVGKTKLRAAHVYAFDAANKISLGGTFSGMNGTLVSSDGVFTIKGLPFNRPIVVVAEPVNRTDVHPNLTYYAFNTPTEVALSGETNGLLNFAVEAYPDKAVVDIRKEKDSDLAPGIADATTITLTAAAPTATGIDFYLSENFEAPNDPEGSVISFNENTSITNSNPLVITVEAPGSLDEFEDASLVLTATNSSGDKDWSDGIISPTWKGSKVQIAVDPADFRPANGTYTLSFVLADTRFGTFAKSAEIKVTNWTEAAKIGGTSAGGGGCIVSHKPQSPDVFALLAILLVALQSLRFYFRKSFTS